jgi:hypothetical protein
MFQELQSVERAPGLDYAGAAWNELVERAPDPLRRFLSEAYQRVVLHYSMTRNAMPLAVLNRSFNKRLTALCRGAGTDRLSMHELLVSACMAVRFPLELGIGARGGLLLLPKAVEALHWALTVRNAEIENGIYKGPPAEVEPLADFEDIRTGRAAGPPLRGKYKDMALAPFPAAAAAPAPAQASAEIRHPG